MSRPIAHPTPHINALYDEARYEVRTDGAVSASTGVRLLAEGVDPDQLEDRLRDELNNEEEASDGA